jgi:hypothetical protein
MKLSKWCLVQLRNSLRVSNTTRKGKQRSRLPLILFSTIG